MTSSSLPLGASRDRSIAFVAVVSGASTTVGEQAAHELEQTFRRARLDVLSLVVYGIEDELASWVRATRPAGAG